MEQCKICDSEMEIDFDGKSFCDDHISRTLKQKADDFVKRASGKKLITKAEEIRQIKEQAKTKGRG